VGENKVSTEKLNKVLEIISRNLTQNKIPFAVVGAIALGLYGFPRFTSDIDMITEGRLWPELDSIMKKLGYSCYQKTDVFAQFESELGAMGYIDFMFVNTPDGLDILNRSVLVEDELLGKVPVVQPTDYIILKMMAIANNPDRSIKDKADISTFITLYRNRLLPDYFEPLDMSRIHLFADRFGQTKLIDKYFDQASSDDDENGPFTL
jgi:predicted nucleotidyltransferase